MADQAEHAFIKTFVNTISTQPVTYGDDYQQPPENSLRKVPILHVPVPAPPAPKETTASSSSTTLNLTIKSTKPPATYTLSGVHPTDTIASIKQHLFSSNPTAPAPDAQRLLLKGKALADNKLLKEYTVKDGDTINLMVKPGVEWNPSAPPPVISAPEPTPAPKVTPSVSSSLLEGSPKPSGKRSHQRIPSVVLSPSPSHDDLDAQPKKDVLLTLDTTDLALGPGSTVPKETLGSYHVTISSPDFWNRMIAFLRTQFSTESDALTAFEDFLAASKGSLSASDVAKIRDHVGVVGMAGT
ncbi:hypothetical protein BDP27DRAFT_1393924 [Rhodocollybia butyracea]|uniref:Ubiquitin-like domain-containing protein n=1 Tax=Rhodocollybia butyracea TaxID=206335 RepID=A0A9P5PGG7_9AGAR|nr:hypothetical protein BDP27DRAFT_1393924 [Rhodocollybia butyracea]